ncbi:MAG TPA: ATP-dependent helicase, partial [Leptolyngbyaceae cyanobacterium M65_K2018_010]|nr:ATP-dependent helicase [Leptolyngbyaceae cyanobacterium M65_K2018_010]
SKRATAKTDHPLWGKTSVPLPSFLEDAQIQPIHSASGETQAEAQHRPAQVLHPWQLEGWWLAPPEVLPLLLALPLGQFALAPADLIGSDLRFWGHMARWGLNLLARGKYLPTLELTSERLSAGWRPLLDSAADQERLRNFTQAMPLICRSYLSPSQPAPTLSCSTSFTAPQDLILSFLTVQIDHQVRQVTQTQPLNGLNTLGQELPLQAWLQALTLPQNTLDASPAAAARLQEALTTWTIPLQSLAADPAAQFRLRLVLQPPESLERPWQLHYHLQSIAVPDWQPSALFIWQHPGAELRHRGAILESPQETLLAGLGRAARLYTPIRESLRQPQPTHCELDSIQAYQFIKAVAWQLQDNGVEVELPPGLATTTDDNQSRLGLKVQAEVPATQQRQRLGLKSLLNFKWELSLAGQTLSAAEFEQLISQGSPLVEINGQWVELKPQEVKAAQRFLEGQKTATPLSVEDALRISTGDTQLIDKLPVVSFEASGALQKLIDTLTTGHQSLEEIADPPGFKGKLRPYQARGVSWLAFLEQWGLGACLADDMGLGKTIQLIAFLLHLQAQGWLAAPVLLVCPTSVL